MWEWVKTFVRGAFVGRGEVGGGALAADIGKLCGGGLASPGMLAAQRAWAGAFYDAGGAVPGAGRDGGWVPAGFAGVVSAYAATLCVAELQLDCGAGARAAFVQDQLARHVLRDIRSSVQKAAALSFVAMKPYVEGGNIFCDVATPDRFFPTGMAGGVVHSGVFVDVAEVGGRRFVRLEEHLLQEGCVSITNRAYRLGAVKKGAEVPLSVLPRWAGMVPEVVVEGVSRPLFAILKMPFANQADPHSPLPVSLYANALGSFAKIDRIYNDFLWELESGRRKQIVDITAVRRQGRPAEPLDLARYETTDQFIALDMGDAGKLYDDYTPEMRVGAYRQGLNLAVRMMESQVGLAPGTFDFDPAVGAARARTATEVLADKNDTYNTVKAIQENGLKQGLLDLVGIYDAYAGLYGLAPAGPVAPGVVFGDSVFEDTGTEFARRKALADAGYLKPEELLGWYFGTGEEGTRALVP